MVPTATCALCALYALAKPVLSLVHSRSTCVHVLHQCVLIYASTCVLIYATVCFAGRSGV